MKWALIILVFSIVAVLAYKMFLSGQYGKQCGGFAANLSEYQCPSYLKCVYEETGPDASGVCKFI